MAKEKVSKDKDGNTIHYSAGALIRKENKILLIDRAIVPLGFACLAGHVDEGEDPIDAVIREAKEEAGITITKAELVIEEVVRDNTCSKGVSTHHWYVFECEAQGELKRNARETNSIGWYSLEQIEQLRLEPVWEYWFKKLRILK